MSSATFRYRDSVRAAGAGAVSRMWAGLLVGILLGLFTAGHAL
jgi:hypothetical protein